MTHTVPPRFENSHESTFRGHECPPPQTFLRQAFCYHCTLSASVTPERSTEMSSEACVPEPYKSHSDGNLRKLISDAPTQSA